MFRETFDVWLSNYAHATIQGSIPGPGPTTLGPVALRDFGSGDPLLVEPRAAKAAGHMSLDDIATRALLFNFRTDSGIVAWPAFWEFSRDGGTNWEAPPALDTVTNGEGIQPNGGEYPVGIDGALPADFLKANRVGDADTVLTRVTIDPFGGESGDVTCWLLLVPGKKAGQAGRGRGQ